MTKHSGRAIAVRTDPGKPLTFLAASESLARDGLTINIAGMDTRAYEANPVLTWHHDFSGIRPPIGRTKRLTKTDQGLVAEFELDPEDDFAMTVHSKIVRGFINAASISWDSKTINGNRVETSELLEIAIVNVPSDATALALARSAYGRSLTTSSHRTIEEQLIELRDMFIDSERTRLRPLVRRILREELLRAAR